MGDCVGAWVGADVGTTAGAWFGATGTTSPTDEEIDCDGNRSLLASTGARNTDTKIHTNIKP